jgi:mono/diheme cytochrome c family protein
MPERVVAFERAGGTPAIAVVFGGTSEVQTFDVAPDGALSARETAGTLYPTGMGAVDAVVSGRALVVVARLGESLSVLDLDTPAARTREVVVGDVAAGAFPATDAELGEAFNTLTALFTVDGDQTCVHCHRDGSPIGKDVSMPLLVDPAFGTRLVMSYRGAADTRPWFFEAGMDDSNFFPVINELARRENFCCEGTDPRIWRALPPRADCEADPTREGCNHVLNCEEDPPPACAERRYGSPYLRRDEHFRAAARRVFGRDTTFGDVLYTERLAPDGTIERRPLNLGFEGITRALGVFLRTRIRLLPNPNAASPPAEVALGAVLYGSSEVGCASCHPLPLAATAVPDGRIALPFVVTPERHPDTGADLDRITPGFLGTFPRARQDEAGLRIGVTSLRGAWDRVRFLHAGSARSLREVLLTPGHAARLPGERARNERDGVPNTHGGTGHLDAREIDALVAFLETL